MQPYRRPLTHAFSHNRCYVCSREAKHTCRNCGKSICDLHYSGSMGLCSSCASRKTRSLIVSQGQGQARAPGTPCAVCANEAKHTCKHCGKHVCDAHFDLQQGICVMCKIRTHREMGRHAL